ncbi:MAG: SMP-30/gluconolactonase/LRE family protein [Tannerellaceae bacterium]|jgi:gluconolactonase|nr:SMP-30/gluconolactonase/LRE family protein [Tannerellaceae bacterium]
MNKTITLFCLLLPLICTTACTRENKGVIAPGAIPEKVADGFSFTEGPAVDKNGNVYFTDQPNDRIWKWSSDNGTVSIFLENTGRANGMYFDKNGNLLSCSDMDNEIWSISPDGGHTVVAADYEGKKLNGPNDLWIHPNGNVYFTDPLYKREYWTRDPEMQQDGQHLYYIPLSSGRKNIIRIDNQLEQPNGIIGSPDGKLLYVADIRAGKTYVYDIAPDGSLSGKKLFAPMGSDGMTMDERGNIYLTGKGITVFNPQGEQIEHIPVEARWTANVCFGGKDMKTLLITASQYLYTLKMNVKGIR